MKERQNICFSTGNLILNFRDSCRSCSKKTVLKNFAIFTGKHLYWSHFLIFTFHVLDLPACNFIKKRLQHKFFPVKFAKFLRTIVLKNIGKRLLLNISAFDYTQSLHKTLKITSFSLILSLDASLNNFNDPYVYILNQHQILFSLRVHIGRTAEKNCNLCYGGMAINGLSKLTKVSTYH